MKQRRTKATKTWEVQTDPISGVQIVSADSFLIIDGSLHFYDVAGDSVACFKHWNWFRVKA